MLIVKLHESTAKQLTLFGSLKMVLTSGLANSIFSTLVWFSIRFINYYFFSGGDWTIGWNYALLNAVFVFFNVHLIISGSYLAFHYLTKANKFKLQKNEAEKASGKAKFRLLQQQVTPHFLFNNLNVLSWLITSDPNLAEKYVIKFSHLYRYMLKNRDEDLVSLKAEIEFVKDYIDLTNIRFEDAYVLDLQIQRSEDLASLVAPGALQTLVENAIKHNVASNNEPLKISMFVKSGLISVFNEKTGQPKNVLSTGVGLINLTQRYQSLTDDEVVIDESSNFFSVSIPLIEVINENSNY